MRFDVEDAIATEIKGSKMSSGNQKLVEAVKAISLCHNVTPVYDYEPAEGGGAKLNGAAAMDGLFEPNLNVSYQASSPDEVETIFHSVLAC